MHRCGSSDPLRVGNTLELAPQPMMGALLCKHDRTKRIRICRLLCWVLPDSHRRVCLCDGVANARQMLALFLDTAQR
jgi:hypothetical protein